MRAPKKSGTLVGNIGIHDEGTKGVMVGYLGALSHGNRGGGREQRGAWVESGTKPHPIRARRADSLFFAGANIESVDHPGSRGQRVASKAMRAAEWEVLGDIADRLRRTT